MASIGADATKCAVLGAQQLTDCLSRVNESQLDALGEAILSADRIFVTGAGRSLLALRAIAMRFMHLGLTAYVVGDVTTPAFGAGDLLIAGSGSGTTGSVVRVAEKSTGVYKQHVMEALCELPYSDAAYQSLYRSLFKGQGVAARDISYPSAVEVVRAIREQGGTAVLAHPGQMDSWSAIAGLVGEGLQGIEAFHPDHDGADERRAMQLAAEFGLFVTGGSDYHGRYGAPERRGERFVTLEEAGDRLAHLLEAEAALS